MIIDAFPYFNEEELCLIRLNYLQDAVDKFIIVESNQTWRCRPNKQKFLKVLEKVPQHITDKIVYKWVEHPDEYLDSEEHTNLKTIQNITRDNLVYEARKITDKAIFFYSDLDEIWDKRGLAEIKRLLKAGEKQIVCDQDLRVVYLDWYARMRNWPGTRITNLENLPEEKPLSTGAFKYTKAGAFKRHTVIKNGWHFSYFGSDNQRTEKIANIKNAMDWERKAGMSYAQIATRVKTIQEWNNVVRKKKIQGRQLDDNLQIDTSLQKEFLKFDLLSPWFKNKYESHLRSTK
jgi:hypothetical protein